MAHTTRTVRYPGAKRVWCDKNLPDPAIRTVTSDELVVHVSGPEALVNPLVIRQVGERVEIHPRGESSGGMVFNHVSGKVSGPVTQARTIVGGVHWRGGRVGRSEGVDVSENVDVLESVDYSELTIEVEQPAE